MELKRGGKPSNAIKLGRSQQSAQVFAAREELGSLLSFAPKGCRANRRRQRSRQAAAPREDARQPEEGPRLPRS